MLISTLGILPHGMPEVKDVKPAITKEEEEEEELHNKGKKKRAEEEEKKRLQELSEEEKQVRQQSTREVFSSPRSTSHHSYVLEWLFK